MKNYLYFLKDINENSFWDGSYSYEISQKYNENNPNHNLRTGFRNRPRYFKTAAPDALQYALWATICIGIGYLLYCNKLN